MTITRVGEKWIPHVNDESFVVTACVEVLCKQDPKDVVRFRVGVGAPPGTVGI